MGEVYKSKEPPTSTIKCYHTCGNTAITADYRHDWNGLALNFDTSVLLILQTLSSHVFLFHLRSLTSLTDHRQWPGAARVFPQGHASVPGERWHLLSEKLHYKCLILAWSREWRSAGLSCRKRKRAESQCLAVGEATAVLLACWTRRSFVSWDICKPAAHSAAIRCVFFQENADALQSAVFNSPALSSFLYHGDILAHYSSHKSLQT